MKKVLLFQVENPMLVKQAIATMRIRVEAVPMNRYYQIVKDLVSGDIKEEVKECETAPQGSLLLLCGLTNAEVDQLLYRLRSKKITTTYKAILTPTNQTWNVLELFDEMEKEKQVMEARHAKK